MGKVRHVRHMRHVRHRNEEASAMTDILDLPPRSIEFCCDSCLRSIRSLDTEPIPRCARCGIRMTPDSDEPARRPVLHRVMAQPDARQWVRAKGKR